MKIEQIMSKPVDPIDPTTTVAAAAQRMRDEDVGCLLIGRHDHLCGIITDRDIVIRVLAAGRNPHRLPVWAVMTSPVVWCAEGQRVEETAKIMAEHGIRRLPVLDRKGLLSGVASKSDVRGEARRKKPYHVTFYREITDGRGTVHEAPLTTLYVATAGGKDEAAVAARKMLERDCCYPTQWRDAADGHRVNGRPEFFSPASAAGKCAERSGHIRDDNRAKLSPPRGVCDASALQ
jgi:CBS domain-containing protein